MTWKEKRLRSLGVLGEEGNDYRAQAGLSGLRQKKLQHAEVKPADMLQPSRQCREKL